jgi:predicted lipoprotein with Yx(FWY)xxD motif
MKRSLMTLSTLAGVAVDATAPSPPPTTVAPGSTSLGSVLVDNQGRMLYLFEADADGTSACTSPGAVAEWPPLLTTGPPQATGGLTASALGTTTRRDGARQVTDDGHPLFAGDTQPGAMGGQGINDNGGLWYPVRADGTPAVG